VTLQAQPRSLQAGRPNRPRPILIQHPSRPPVNRGGGFGDSVLPPGFRVLGSGRRVKAGEATAQRYPSGHDSERAAMIYQHEAQGADKTITHAIDTRPSRAGEAGRRRRRVAGVLVPLANGPLMARTVSDALQMARRGLEDDSPDLAFCLGAGDGNRTALSAREVCGAVARLPADRLTCGSTVLLSVSDRGCPRWLLRSGT
jgi:hypothetical protein